MELLDLVMLLKIGVFVVLAVCLSTSAGAKPTRTVDNQTGNISIIDNFKEQKIFMSVNKVIYINKQRKWTKIPPKEYNYVDTVITPYGVILAWSNKKSNNVVIGLFHFDGLLKWTVDLGNMKKLFKFEEININRFLRYSYSGGENTYDSGGSVDLIRVV